MAEAKQDMDFLCPVILLSYQRIDSVVFYKGVILCACCLLKMKR